MPIVALQPELCPVLPLVVGNVDYLDFRANLERIDALLKDGGVESAFLQLRLQEVARAEAERAMRDGDEPRPLGTKDAIRLATQASRALRSNIARALVGDNCREFSCRLADSALLQWFCGLSRMDVIRVPSKSTLDRYSRMVSEDLVREVITGLTQNAAAVPESGNQCLGLEEPLSLATLLVDTTCVAANIHFPVDWVLLRDIARTLIKGVAVIRRHGLRHRMSAPADFLRQVNRLCIEMTHSRRRSEGRKERKRILRLLKKLLKTIAGHANHHRTILLERWQKTDLHEGEVQQIVARLDNVLEQLPAAIKQAHERIIGGRLVENRDKLLSVYERDVHVIVRGKAGAEVEFGNTLLLAEQADGVIVDWDLVRDQAPSDSNLVRKTLARFKTAFDRWPGSVVGDRGFDSAENRSLLGRAGVYNAICPKGVSQLRARMQEERFVELQRRRGQTEGRLSIFKNCFLGRPIRHKGFINRELGITWSVLAHNLWVLARLPVADAERRRDAA